MTREEKCLSAIERGFTYNPDTGQVFGIYGKENKTLTKGYYKFSFKYNGKIYKLYAHQFAWYYINKECVDCIDHINGNKIDNRIVNLRSIPNQQNIWNTKKTKGYTWCKKDKKYIAKISVNRKLIYLGSYDTENEAREAYLEAKKLYHKI